MDPCHLRSAIDDNPLFLRLTTLINHIPSIDSTPTGAESSSVYLSSIDATGSTALQLPCLPGRMSHFCG